MSWAWRWPSVAGGEDRVALTFWTLYFVAVAASIVVLGAVTVA